MLDMKKMGEQITSLRQRNKFTQEKLAEKLGISSQAVSKWENGNAVPGVALLLKMSELFHCPVDVILNPKSTILHSTDFNYEFTVLPRAPVADYSGTKWPKSIMFGSLFTAIKLFFGLEERRDHLNCQMNDDSEYILQSAISNICFGYSYAPAEIIRDSLLIYGLDYEMKSQQDFSEDEFIALARNQIENGYPVVIIPKEYRDVIFAVGYSDQGRVLKGLCFLDGCDDKNIQINFNQLNQCAGWYRNCCDMLILKPAGKTLSVEQACINALRNGVRLLLNTEHSGEDKMRGYGMVIYQNWTDLLKEENVREADQIYCVYPHAFIHYEDKLIIKQFLEMSMNIIPGIDKEYLALAIKQYDEIISFAYEIMMITSQLSSVPKEALKEKRSHIIERLRRSRELEEYALAYIQKAMENLSE